MAATKKTDLDLQQDETRFMVRSTVQRLTQFNRALDVLGVDRDAYINATMKQCVLNALTLIEEHGWDGAVSAHEAREALLAAWYNERLTFAQTQALSG